MAQVMEGFVLDGLDLNVPEVAQVVNLVTNPRAAFDLTGVGGASAGVTVSREISSVPPGLDFATAAKAVAVGAAVSTSSVMTAWSRTGVGTGTSAFPVLPSTRYAARISAVITALTAGSITDLRARVYWYTAAGAASAVTSSVVFQNSGAVVLGAVVNFEAVVDSPSDAAFGRIVVNPNIGAVADYVGYSAGAMLAPVGAADTVVPPYFAGDTQGYRWTGAAHASTSEPAPKLSATALHFTPARERPEWAEPADGDGAQLVRDPKFTNSSWEATIEVRGGSRDEAHADAAALAAKLQEAAENRGGIPLEWTPADASKALTFYALTGEVNEMPITVESGYFADTPILALSVTITCGPFGYRPERGALTDDFSVDTLGTDWDVFQDPGGVSVAGGQLVPATTTEKRLRRTDLATYDAEVTVKHTTPSAFAATYLVGVILKYIDDDNLLYVRVAENGAGATAITVRKRVAGVDTNLNTLTAPSALAVSTAYHLRARIEGNLITVQHLDASKAPLTGGGTHTLTAGDITQFGQGVSGNPGLTWAPQANTSARIDDFSVAENVWKGTGPLQVVGPIYGVEGEVDAEARLVVTDTASQSRDLVIWGREWRHQNGSDLLLTQPDLTATGFAGTSTTRAGSVSTNIYRGTLTTTPVAVCGTGNQPHVGSYRAFARLWASDPAVRARLSYRDGDGPLKALEWETPPAEDAWVTVDLGVVTVEPTLLGTQRWQGRVEAYSSDAGHTVDVDLLMLVPVEAYGRARRPAKFETPSVFSVRDEFDQAAGALTGKALPVGGTWAGAGDADDFALETTGHTARRTATGDVAVGSGRWGLAGAGTYASVVVQVDFRADTYTVLGTDDMALGLFARYGATSDAIRAYLLVSNDALPPGPRLVLSSGIGSVDRSLDVAAPVDGATYTIRLHIDAAGRYWLWYWPSAQQPGAPVMVGSDPTLATGGAQDSGQVGIYDAWTGAGVRTRDYDNFLAFVPATDAVCFAGRSIQFRSDEAVREDATGVYAGQPKEYRGAPFLLPPAGAENRAARLAVMMRRNDIYELPEVAPADAQTVQVFTTSRHLYLPPG